MRRRATFGTRADADLLCEYLDRYLLRRDLDYDQRFVLGTPMCLDEVLGFERSSRFLAPGGLWSQWADGPLRTDVPLQRYQQTVEKLCAFARESAGFFTLFRE